MRQSGGAKILEPGASAALDLQSKDQLCSLLSNHHQPVRILSLLRFPAWNQTLVQSTCLPAFPPRKILMLADFVSRAPCKVPSQILPCRRPGDTRRFPKWPGKVARLVPAR